MRSILQYPIKSLKVVSCFNYICVYFSCYECDTMSSIDDYCELININVFLNVVPLSQNF